MEKRPANGCCKLSKIKKKKRISPDFEEMETSSIRFESKEKIFEKV